MQLLWQRGEMKPSEVQECFSEPIKNSAVRFYLSALLENGHVERRRVGNAFYYKAKIQERRALRSMLAELMETFCGSSGKSLVMTLLEAEELTPEQLLELSRVAAESAAKTQNKSANKTKKGPSDE